jgi:hypothetical protein
MVAIDVASFYCIQTAVLSRALHDGRSPAMVLPIPDNDRFLGLTSTSVYFAEKPTAGAVSENIVAVARVGGQKTTIAMDQAPIGPFTMSNYGNVYWTDTLGPEMALSGGDGTIKMLALNATAGDSIVLSRSYLYWHSAGGVFAVPAIQVNTPLSTINPSTPTSVDSPTPATSASNLVSDGTNVYWYQGSPNPVIMSSVMGTNTYSMLSGPFMSPGPPAVDGGNIYFKLKSGVIMKVPVDGSPTSSVDTGVAGEVSPVFVFYDAIYFSASGHAFRVAKF